MKVIDLLNKIANGEEVPKEIQWSGVTFRYVEKENYDDYVNENNCSLFRHDNGIYKVTNMLDSEVEIIEEPKEIESLIYDEDCTNEWCIKELYEKVEEIRKVVNELKKEEK